MTNIKKIYSQLLSNTLVTELVPEENIFNAYPNEVEIFPCIIFLDDNQSDGEYADNKSTSDRCSVMIHIFSKKLDGYVTTSTIAEKVANVFNSDLWHCSQNGETSDPDPDAEHRVMRFEKSIYIN